MEELISVVMPIYYPNQIYFEKAIESLINQSYKNIEIIIVSDGNERSLEDYLDRFDNSHIRLMKNPIRLGLIESLNRGIIESRGGLIARLDSDDISLPDRLEKEKKALDMNPSLGMVGSNALIIGVDGQPLSHRNYPETYSELRRTILSFCPFAHSSVMMRREALDNVGKYNPNVVTEDYDLWIRMAEKYECTNLHEPLVEIRNTDSSITWKRQRLVLLSMLRLKIRGIASGKFPVSFITIISTLATLTALFIPRRFAQYIVKALTFMGYYEGRVSTRML